MVLAHRVVTVGAALARLGASLAPAIGGAQDAAPSAPGIETIVVTDRALQAEIELTAGAVTLVDADELRERNASSLADLLRFVPGIWAESSNGTDAMFFSSRGSNLDATNYDANGIALFQDGLRVSTADGNNHNRVLDPLSARFATVARGANALKYGAATLGGAIDFSSPTARNSDPVAVYLNGGSHGQLIARGTIGRVFGEKLDGLATFEAKRWDGFRNHSEQTRDGLYANVGWRPSAGTESRFFLSYVTNEEELPGYLTRAQLSANPHQANPATATGNFQLDVDSLRFANRTVMQLDARSRIEYGFYVEEQELYHPIVDVRIGGVQVFSLLIDTDHREAGGMLRFDRRTGAHDWSLGLHYGRGEANGGNYVNDGGNRGALTSSIERSASTLALYVLDRLRLRDDLMLELGMQGVHADREVASVDAATGRARAPRGSFSQLTPRAGLVYAASDSVDVFASLSGLFEPPTNYQLEDEATGSDAILAAMSGAVLEVGTRGQRAGATGNQLLWEASIYYAAIEDEILSVDDPSAPGTSLSANVGGTTHAGIEAALGAELRLGAGVLAPRASITINAFSFDDDPIYGDNDLPVAPGYALRGELIYRHSSGFFVGPTVDVVDDRFADFMNTYRVESYSLLGLRAGWSRPRWNLFADLVNAADERYVAVLGVRDRAGADAEVLSPGSPRSLYFGVHGRF